MEAHQARVILIILIVLMIISAIVGWWTTTLLSLIGCIATVVLYALSQPTDESKYL
jgi:heme A synthase